MYSIIPGSRNLELGMMSYVQVDSILVVSWKIKLSATIVVLVDSPNLHVPVPSMIE